LAEGSNVLFIIHSLARYSNTKIKSNLLIIILIGSQVHIGLGLAKQTDIKKEPAQPEWPKQDRKI
jgi:hypothetical protein